MLLKLITKQKLEHERRVRQVLKTAVKDNKKTQEVY